MSKIEWTDQSWNPIVGCSLASPGCTNCYAMRFAGTRLGHVPKYDGLTQPSKAGPVWTGNLGFDEKALLEPLRWKKPRMVFVNSMGDLFHEDCPDKSIDRVFAVMALCPQHTFQVLTKRSARMREYLAPHAEDRVMDLAFDFACSWFGRDEAELHYSMGRYRWPLPNVWLGVSVEDQQRADERIPDLLATPSAVRWISAEPLLGPVDLRGVPVPVEIVPSDTPRAELQIIDWVVAGGESGKGARPMHPDWARSLRDQCAAAGVPFFFKQWGEWMPAGDHLAADAPEHLRLRDGKRTHVFREDHQQIVLVGKKRAGRLLDGVLHDAMPEVRT